MATQYEPKFRFQYSLRTLIIVISVLGVGIGMLGRLFISDPPVFLGVMSIISSVVPFLLAIITIFWLGFRPKPSWLTPLCGACKHDFGSAKTDQLSNCPQCGANLIEANALQFPRWPTRRWGLIIWAGLLLLMPPIGFTTLYVAQLYIGSSPSSLRFQSNQQLIGQQLPKQIDAPWIWRELQYRLANRSLSSQEVDDAVKKLTAYMTNKPGGWNQPLHWQNDFMKSAIQNRAISEQVLFGLCDAYFGSKPVIHLPHLREGKTRFEIDIKYGNPFSNMGFGIELAWQVQRVLVDDKPIKFQKQYQHGNMGGYYHEGSKLSAGDHKVTVEIECAYIDQSKLTGLNINDLPVKKWPKARKQWKQSVSATMQVYPVDKPIVSLVTDLARDPGPAGGVKSVSLVARAERDGRKKIALEVAFDELPLPLSYDVAVVFDGQSIKLGHVWRWISQNRNGSGGGGNHQLQAIIDKLDPTILSADIVLTPDPSPIEQRPEVSEIWGKKTVIKNVEMERLDLEE
jgi:hypothetical protein